MIVQGKELEKENLQDGQMGQEGEAARQHRQIHPRQRGPGTIILHILRAPYLFNDNKKFLHKIWDTPYHESRLIGPVYCWIQIAFCPRIRKININFAFFFLELNM